MTPARFRELSCLLSHLPLFKTEPNFEQPLRSHTFINPVTVRFLFLRSNRIGVVSVLRDHARDKAVFVWCSIW
jgi:hypothetical protein